jgi:hypothetical protein
MFIAKQLANAATEIDKVHAGPIQRGAQIDLLNVAQVRRKTAWGTDA